jgi:hypothetical protein
MSARDEQDIYDAVASYRRQQQLEDRKFADLYRFLREGGRHLMEIVDLLDETTPEDFDAKVEEAKREKEKR